MESLKRLPILVLALSVCVLSITLNSCKRKKIIEVDPEFAKYIEAYTSGVVSKKSSIRIQLATDASATHTVNENIKEALFNFSPAVEGKAFWVDARTIEFKPTKDLDIDKLYEVEFKLSKVLNVPKKFREFKFNVQTFKPSFQINDNGLRSLGKETMMLTGEIVTADVEESKKVENILTASMGVSNLTIKWQHNEANKTHSYTIENIKRGTSANNILLKWDGSFINANIKDQKEIAVPAIGDFKVMDIKVVQEEEQYALVQFSDPLMIGQQLEGLINISQQENLSYTILGSEVKVYASGKLDGGYTATVLEGIQNMWGDKLPKAFTSQIFFENRLPSVKIFGKGVILPNSGGKILLPFEATNLKAVDVSIIKIYENNIPQFFQNNKMDEDENLRRVAKPTVTATVKLDEDKSLNLHKKNRFTLDLDKYIKTEQGAIYRICIAFRPDYSLYTCTAKADGDEENENDYYDDERTNGVDDEDEFWRKYDNYNPYGYNWQQRDNPCSKAYYNRDRFAFRNILATNIGLTAKRGTDKSMMVAVNNIITTEPMSGVDLQVLDYQQQIVGKGSSNSDGIAMIEFKRKPYLLVAKKGNEKSYLRLDDGNSLPLARFNIDGVQIKNGIKGFVFGERGVWRPGDSLFLGCIIEDKEKKLPAAHPVEMELISPRGQLYKRIVQPNADDGYNVFRTATDANAPTGNWLCKVKVGGAAFEKTIKIETVMPNRLKIDLNFNGALALGKNVTQQGTLTAKWLFGADAQNLKAKVDAQLYRKNTTFDNYKDFEFDNPISKFSSQSKTIFDGSLSATGTASISPQFDAGENPPGMLLANLMIKVFEPGGNFSIDNVNMPYHPYASYIGLKMPDATTGWGYLQNNKSYNVNVVDVNTNGAATTGNTDVEVQLYKVQWRWWWDRSEDDYSNFTQDEYNKLIRKENVSISNGKGIYSLKLNAGDYGRYLILMKDTRSGHTTGSSFYVSDYAHQNYGGDNDASSVSMLSFTADKAKYNVGDECKLTVPSPANGKMLVSIESGTKVLQTKWVSTQKGETKYSFKIDKTMTPNVYVNISMLQPHAQTINDLPIRMYGVIPIEVEDKNTILKPVIKINDIIRPEEKTSITVSEQSGKSMTYCIAIVDDGLLDLTHFKTPNPHDAFYAKEALGVKSWDVYDYVIGAWGGQLDRILTIGGDAEGDDASKGRRANRFKPIVQYYGPFKSNGSSKTHNFTLPNYMGSVRAMVIAAGNGAYGAAEKSVKVKKPLMVLATMPRVLGPAEDLKIPVTVFATENNIKNVTVSIQSNPMIETVTGSNNIKFDKMGEQVVYLNAKVKNAVGMGKIKVVATSGGNTSYHEIEIDVRNPNPHTTQVTEYTLQAGQSFTSTVTMIGDANSSKATIEVSSIPAINLQKRLSYLIQYPHGCIEQTTSSVFPQLALNGLMELNDKQKADIDKNIRVAIQKIQNFQTSNGGFSYWPGNMDADEWGTNYAGHFLIEAGNKGYNVSSSMMAYWKSYQRSKANAWNVSAAPWYGTDLTQAYRLYLLALAKAPEQGAMNRLKEFKFLTPEAKWRLAAAYYLTGQTTVANQLISGLPTTFAKREYWGMSYGSDVRDDAMVLETLTLMKRQGEAEQLVRTIASKLSLDSWYSTQTTAYSLIAIAKYCGENNGKKITASVNAGSINANINSSSTIAQQLVGWQNGKAAVKLTNKGSNVLYVRVINQGQPIGMQPIVFNNNPNVLQLSVNYLNTSGSAIDITKLKQGTDFVAKVVVTNPGTRGAYSQMALSQIFPSGWEILNTRMYNSEGAFQSSKSDYMDIRDDRVYHYFNIASKETLTYYVQLNAAYLGKYYLPGVYCEAMYDNTISAGSGGKIVVVE
ncbi:MAG: alpha-2-macroglobulin family protein [Chitinophagaceae bacterium]